MGGRTEARRTRGLDLRRREQLNVQMSAWPPRDYCVWAVRRLGTLRGLAGVSGVHSSPHCGKRSYDVS